MQKSVFPEGIYYNAENNTYRTPLINEFVFQTSTISTVLENIKNEKAPQFVGHSPEVHHKVRLSNSFVEALFAFTDH